MIEKQRRIITICMVALGASLLCVPYLVNGHAMGYSLVGDPPHPRATLDMGRIVLEWVAIAFVGAVAWMTYGRP
ncbi:hypothetical protein E4Q23_17050 [Candidatus Accumulibacter phosphatis]|uniref:Uncharacterized protein n=1 Tax=Candidatus Accumulibacter phosphatis TaxID=327160 RepID=A0ABX1U1H1_9PROT|nr:hypothetical protein [Candidatus Accumulibacter phosphatis]NMQ29318.1 hypothetical protein [Candidatus Accumulibacter phosphatis]